MRDENHIPTLRAMLGPALATALDDVGEETVKEIQKGFDEGHAADGTPWEPLAPATVAAKGHSQILVDSGEMRESIEYDVDTSDLTLEISSDSDKLIYHEFGTERMPARPVLTPAADVAGDILRKKALVRTLNLTIAKSLMAGGTTISLGDISDGPGEGSGR